MISAGAPVPFQLVAPWFGERRRWRTERSRFGALLQHRDAHCWPDSTAGIAGVRPSPAFLHPPAAMHQANVSQSSSSSASGASSRIERSSACCVLDIRQNQPFVLKSCCQHPVDTNAEFCIAQDLQRSRARPPNRRSTHVLRIEIPTRA